MKNKFTAIFAVLLIAHYNLSWVPTANYFDLLFGVYGSQVSSTISFNFLLWGLLLVVIRIAEKIKFEWNWNILGIVIFFIGIKLLYVNSTPALNVENPWRFFHFVSAILAGSFSMLGSLQFLNPNMNPYGKIDSFKALITLENIVKTILLTTSFILAIITTKL